MTEYVILCRVSTKQQKESKHGIDGQEFSCREFVQQEGGLIKALPAGTPAVFYEEDYSGSLPLEKRPSLQTAINALSRSNVLLVYKRDRAFRGDFLTVGLIELAIQRRGATLRSVMGEGTEGNDPSHLLMRGITDLFSRHELLLGRLRTKHAMQAKKRKNERVGTIPYGYALCDDAVHLKPIPEQLQVIALMHELRNSGRSYRGIIAELESRGFFPGRSGHWAPQTIKRILERPPVADVAEHASVS